MTPSTEASGVLDWLDRQQPAMLDLLERIVNIDSGSYDHEGVNAAGLAIKAHLDRRGIATEIIPRPDAAFCLAARVEAADAATGTSPILLMGHRDTVFAKGEAARRPFRIEGGKAYGPGVADMKGGLVMNCFVAEAFHRCGGHRHPIRLLFTSDEEIGSPSSKAVIEAMARGAGFVFNSEPGRVNGNIVTGRKGAWFSSLEVHGVAAHSGAAHQHGASAIRALCRKIEALEALTDYETGITANVGLIEGGQSANTVPPFAKASIDIRYRSRADLPDIDAAVRNIAERTDVERTRAEIRKPVVFPPLEPTPANQALFERYVAASAALGLAVEGEYSGGAADKDFRWVPGTDPEDQRQPANSGCGATPGAAGSL
ncbi:MAG: M20 family metallopeptidase, partial [Rhizobiales bacterium]|nr:M20 family metallopeptidase [Hyphomicrobiales bacterium]